MTYELRFERLIDAEPDVVFDTFTETGGQVAFYSGEPGWILRSECDLRVGGVWIASDVIVYGGASFAQSLARLGLIDQYRLITHPVALATGAPLFRTCQPRYV